MKDLTKIPPDSIKNVKNIFFTLGLIRNDFGDLAYLQGLHSAECRRMNLVEGEVSIKSGQIAGRNIYILRLALSQLYSTFEFLKKAKDQIDSDSELKLHLKSLSVEDERSWNLFRRIADCDLDVKNIDLLSGLSQKEKDIIKLSILARHDVTYHYYGSSKWIGEGYDSAFKEPRQKNTKFAYASDVMDVWINRSYYVDLSVKKYLENKIGLNGDLIGDVQSSCVSFMARFHRVISLLLLDYHERIKVSDS